MNTFYLDPDNENFIPGRSPLKLNLVHGDNVAPFEGCLYTFTCLPLAIILMIVMGLSGLLTLRYLTQGVTTNGVIEACRYERSEPDGDGGIEIFYRYISSEQKAVTESDVLFGDVSCNTISTGDTLQIQYLANSTSSSSRIIDTRLIPSPANTVIQTIAFGSLFLGLVMFSVWGIKSLLRFIRALLWLPQLKKGILLDGILIDCINQAEYRRHPGLQTTYQFKSPVGRELTRRQFYRRDDLLNEQLPEPGTPVKILYASDNCYVML